MPAAICTTCGTQYHDAPAPPAGCAVCLDERQYVGTGGQSWTTLDALRARHRTALQRLEPDLYAIGSVPDFGIGQRALLLRRPEGNVLWDCVAPLNDAAIDVLRALGGLSAIAVSHPHFFTTMVEWARAFDCPIVLHADLERHVRRPDPAVRFWEGDTHALAPGLTLVRLGGHFRGSTVLHWAAGAGGAGALCTGDTIQVVPDTRWVSFMRSYPNLVPLPIEAVDRIVAGVEPFAFERLYSPWPDRHVLADAKQVVRRSAERYRAAIGAAVPA